MEQVVSEVLNWADSSFKYILIIFNFMTLIVVYLHKNKQKLKKQHHVLFVTAHPDDEVMFFRPSLSSIAKDYFVHLLCLTGKGTEREHQLKKVAQKYKLHKVECLGNQKLRDEISQKWPNDQIQCIVLGYIKQNNIKAIFTFDQYGVSGHQNHKSIGRALSQLEQCQKQLKILNKKQKSLNQQERKTVQKIKRDTIKIYHLNSVNLIRKYTGILEILLAVLRDFSWINLNLFDAYKSMSLHQSQFLWYRKLWVFFSQYSYINTFTMGRIKIKGVSKTTHELKQTSQVQENDSSRSQRKQSPAGGENTKSKND